jgi:hypothetical protein
MQDGGAIWHLQARANDATNMHNVGKPIIGTPLNDKAKMARRTFLEISLESTDNERAFGETETPQTEAVCGIDKASPGMTLVGFACEGKGPRRVTDYDEIYACLNNRLMFSLIFAPINPEWKEEFPDGIDDTGMFTFGDRPTNVLVRVFRAHNWSRTIKQTQRVILGYMMIGYIFLAGTALEPFSCVKDISGKRFIHAEPSIECNWCDTDYRHLASFAIVWFTLYGFGTPILFYLILYSNEDKLKTKQFMDGFGFLSTKMNEE